MQKRLTAQPTRKTKMAMLSLAILLALQGYSGIVQAEGNEDFIWKLQGRQWHVNLGAGVSLVPQEVYFLAAAQEKPKGKYPPLKWGDGTKASRDAIAIGHGTKSSSGYGLDKSSVAIGIEASAYGYGCTALGSNASAVYKYAVAIGNTAMARKAGATAIGYDAFAIGVNSTSLGLSSHAHKDYATTLGSHATATMHSGVAVGNMARSEAVGSIAIGRKSKSEDANTVALGREALAQGKHSMALGYKAHSIYAESLALGPESESGYQYGTVCGYKSMTLNEGASGFGAEVRAKGTNSVAVGRKALSNIQNSIAIGYKSVADGKNAVAIGAETEVNAENGMAVGEHAKANANNVLAFGGYAQGQGENSIVMGHKAQTGQQESIAIGTEAITNYASGTACGYKAMTLQKGASGFGAEVRAKGTNSVAVGYKALSNRENSVAIGNASEAYGYASSAMGAEAKANNDLGMAFGFKAIANVNNSVALGANAETKAVSVVPESTGLKLGNGDYKFTGLANAQNGAVSIGTKGKERQLQNVAAGVISPVSTDAVNGSQLFAVSDSCNKIFTKLSTIDSTITGHKTEINSMISGYKTEINSAISGHKTEIDNRHAQLQQNAASAQAALDSRINALKADALNQSAFVKAKIESLEKQNATKITGDVEKKINEVVDNKVKQVVDSQVKETVESQVQATVDTKVKEAVDNNVKEAVASKVQETVESKIKETIDSQVQEAVKGQAKEAFVKEAKGFVTAEIQKVKEADRRFAEGVYTPDEDGTVTLTVLDGKNDPVGEVLIEDVASKRQQDINSDNLKTVTDKVQNGWTVTVNGKEAQTINPDANTLNFTAGDNISITSEKGGIKISGTITQEMIDNKIAQANINEVSYDADGNKGKITLQGAEGTTISNVRAGEVSAASTEAVNGGQLFETREAVRVNSGRIDKLFDYQRRLEDRTKQVGAKSAALAALHPGEYDPDDKLSFSAGYGNYSSCNAAALGIFYQPNERIILSMGSSFGSGSNMVNAGITFKLGTTSGYYQGRAAMVRQLQMVTERLMALEAAQAVKNTQKP